MTNCPNCGTPNDSASRFCIKCGQALGGLSAMPVSAPSPRRLLLSYTLQFLVGLLVLLLFRSMLIQQPFTEKFRLPDVPLTTPEIITIVVYGIALVLLIQFAQIVWNLWPRAFPQMAPLAPALVAVVYVLVLGAVYTAVERPLIIWGEDPNLLLAVQGVALLIAIGLLVWAGAAIYTFVPAWINSLRFETPPVSSSGSAPQS